MPTGAGVAAPIAVSTPRRLGRDRLAVGSGSRRRAGMRGASWSARITCTARRRGRPCGSSRLLMGPAAPGAADPLDDDEPSLQSAEDHDLAALAGLADAPEPVGFRGPCR